MNLWKKTFKFSLYKIDFGDHGKELYIEINKNDNPKIFCKVSLTTKKFIVLNDSGLLTKVGSRNLQKTSGIIIFKNISGDLKFVHTGIKKPEPPTDFNKDVISATNFYKAYKPS